LPILISFQVIAENLSEEEIVGLKEMFKSMDTDNSGTITFEELKAGLPKLGTKLSESEVRQLMEAVCPSASLIIFFDLFFSYPSNYLHNIELPRLPIWKCMKVFDEGVIHSSEHH